MNGVCVKNHHRPNFSSFYTQEVFVDKSGNHKLRSLIEFNPVSESLLCVASRCSKIDAFPPLRRDCARLRDRRMSCLVSKGPAAVFLLNIKAGASVKSHVLSQFKKINSTNITNFTILDLERGSCKTERS